MINGAYKLCIISILATYYTGVPIVARPNLEHYDQLYEAAVE